VVGIRIEKAHPEAIGEGHLGDKSGKVGHAQIVPPARGVRRPPSSPCGQE
jgi:hypothetical protein